MNENDVLTHHSIDMSQFTSNLTNTICTNRDEKYACLALHAANSSNMKYHQHGCIAVADGTILASGCNSYGSSSPKDKYLQNTCSCHAEVDVMRKIERLLVKKQLHNTNRTNTRARFLSRISIYVVRKNKQGNHYKDSTPCANCGNFMKSLNIKNVIYSNASGTLTKCRVRDYITTYASQGTTFLNHGSVNRENVVL
jgi:deoxycytidylate deaminase